MVNDIAARPDTAGFLDVVCSDRENRTAVDGFGGDDSFFVWLAGGSAGRFGHADNIKHQNDVRLRTLDLRPQASDVGYASLKEV